MGSICPCLSPAEELDEEQKREIAIGRDIDNRKFELIYIVTYVLYKESKFGLYKRNLLRIDLPNAHQDF